MDWAIGTGLFNHCRIAMFRASQGIIRAGAWCVVICICTVFTAEPLKMSSVVVLATGFFLVGQGFTPWFFAFKVRFHNIDNCVTLVAFASFSRWLMDSGWARDWVGLL